MSSFFDRSWLLVKKAALFCYHAGFVEVATAREACLKTDLSRGVLLCLTDHGLNLRQNIPSIIYDSILWRSAHVVALSLTSI